MPNLEKLIIWGADISDRGLSDLAKCRKLKTIWLLDTDIHGEGLKQLSALEQLEELNLSGTRVTASSLQPLKAVPTLKSLSVARTGVSKQEALEYYQAGCVHSGWGDRTDDRSFLCAGGWRLAEKSP